VQVLQLDSRLKTSFRYSLYLFAAAMPFSIFITQVAIGVLLLCWLGRIFITKQLRFQKTGLEYAFLAYLIAELIALVFSTNFGQSVIYLKRFLLIPIVYSLASGIDNEKDLKTAIYIFIISTGLYSLSGIISYIINPNVRVRHIQNSMTEGGITMLGALAAFTVAWFTKKIFWKIIFLSSTIISIICLVLTATRGSWLGFFVGIFIILFYLNKKILLMIPVMIVAFYFLLPANFKTRVENIFNPNYRTNQYRLYWWSVGLKIFKDHPLVGIGDVSTGDMYDKYKDPGDKERIGHFHNNFVHIAVTLGGIGLAAFLYMTIAIFYRLWKIDKKTNYGWALAALAMFVAFHINGLFEWNFGDQEIITMIWFSLGLALVIKPAQYVKTAE